MTSGIKPVSPWPTARSRAVNGSVSEAGSAPPPRGLFDERARTFVCVAMNAVPGSLTSMCEPHGANLAHVSLAHSAVACCAGAAAAHQLRTMAGSGGDMRAGLLIRVYTTPGGNGSPAS